MRTAVSRPTKSAAESAEKPAIIFGRTRPRKAIPLAPPPTGVCTVVLDSNVVLDWLVFRDPSSQAVAAAITTGRLRWIATRPMLDELEHVLTRGSLASLQSNVDEVLARWHTWVTPVEPAPVTPFRALRCTDPDDQKFIDLALQAGASALLSRDRAVLKLAGRARRLPGSTRARGATSMSCPTAPGSPPSSASRP